MRPIMTSKMPMRAKMGVPNSNSCSVPAQKALLSLSHKAESSVNPST